MKARLDKRPSIETVRAMLAYEPGTGILRWLVSSGRAVVGREAGCLDSSIGYYRVRVAGYFLMSHHVAWALMTGEWPERVDHDDTNQTNNQWANLRLCTQSQNLANQKLGSRNSSGFKGVSWHKATQKWQAQITVMGDNKCLGFYSDKESAHAAYRQAAEKEFGEFARFG